MFEIEKKIPVSKTKAKKYPWTDMVDGDSFFAPNIDAKKAASICAIAHKVLPKRGLKPVQRKEAGGYRFWAIAR